MGDDLVRKYVEDSRELWEGHVESVGYSTVGGTIGTHVGPAPWRWRFSLSSSASAATHLPRHR